MGNVFNSQSPATTEAFTNNDDNNYIRNVQSFNKNINQQSLSSSTYFANNAMPVPLASGSEYSYTLVMIGDSGVGKTSLLQRFSNRSFSDNISPTNEIDFFSKTVKIENHKVGLEVWDVSGEERTRVPTSFYQGCHGTLAVYDVSDKASFLNLRKWIEDSDRLSGKEINRVKWLIGNKTDRPRQVSSDEVKEFAKEMGMVTFEVSAKVPENVEKLFYNISESILKQVVL